MTTAMDESRPEDGGNTFPSHIPPRPHPRPEHRRQKEKLPPFSCYFTQPSRQFLYSRAANGRQVKYLLQTSEHNTTLTTEDLHTFCWSVTKTTKQPKFYPIYFHFDTSQGLNFFGDDHAICVFLNKISETCETILPTIQQGVVSEDAEVGSPLLAICVEVFRNLKKKVIKRFTITTPTLYGYEDITVEDWLSAFRTVQARNNWDERYEEEFLIFLRAVGLMKSE
jgi:hypothetical protein